MTDRVKKTAPELVMRVSDMLGKKMTAHIIGAKDVEDVKKWQKEGGLSFGQIRRLKIADEAISALEKYEAPSTIQSLFLGAWPELGDRSPLQVLRDDQPRQARREIRSGISDIIANG